MAGVSEWRSVDPGLDMALQHGRLLLQSSERR